MHKPSFKNSLSRAGGVNSRPRGGRKLAQWSVVASLLSMALVLLLGAPAQAASARVTGEGIDATLNYLFHYEAGLTLTFTLSDTKCNAHPAAATVTLYGRSGQFQYVDYTNSAGCGTTRTYSTDSFRADFDVINMRMCVRGGGNPACTGYLDNPYT
jgi:hypothetical protein